MPFKIKACLGPVLLSLLVGAIGCATSTTVLAAGDDAETVMVTYRVKAGQEAALRKVLVRHWSTVRRLNLVRRSPHLVVRRKDGGTVIMIELFTWRSASTPDYAPAEVEKLWDEMNRLVESRDGKPGVDFSTVEIVDR